MRDDEAAGAHGRDAVALDQLVGDVVEEVALALLAEVAVGVQLERRADRRLRGAARDEADVGHLAQHVVAALGRLRGVAERVVLAGRLRQAREQRGLRQRQLGGGLVEVRPRGGLHADGGLAAVGPVGHGVEVARQDPRLAGAAGVDVLELLGELRLAHLALEGLLLAAGVQRADQLHRQRRAALQRLAGARVLERRADDALEVDALVLVEALVLDRDRRVLHRLRDLRRADAEAQDVVLDEAQPRAVGRQHRRDATGVLDLQRLQRRRRVCDPDDVADRAQDGDHRARGQHREGEDDDAGGAASAATSTLAFEASGHRGDHCDGAGSARGSQGF